jgi:hypothetical protein
MKATSLVSLHKIPGNVKKNIPKGLSYCSRKLHRYCISNLTILTSNAPMKHHVIKGERLQTGTFSNCYQAIFRVMKGHASGAAIDQPTLVSITKDRASISSHFNQLELTNLTSNSMMDEDLKVMTQFNEC